MKTEKKENLNKKKPLFKRMVDFTSNNKLSFLVLFVLGYVLYDMLFPLLCLEWSCFFKLYNIFTVILIIGYIFFIIKMFFWINDEEKVDKNIRDLTKENLTIDINIKDLQKEKLELEIEKLKSPKKTKPIDNEKPLTKKDVMEKIEKEGKIDTLEEHNLFREQIDEDAKKIEENQERNNESKN